MRLSQILAPQVPSQSRARGYAYFSSAAVRSLGTEAGVIQATVRGTELYHVWLEPVGTLLRASCTCPYFIDRSDICKHVWAVILAAEQQSLPLVPPGVAPDSVELEPLVPDDQDVDDHYEFQAPPVAQPRRKSEPAPPWRQLLDAVGVAHSPAPPVRPRLAEGQLLYVIDVAATIATGAVVIELMMRDRKANGDWGKPRPARVGAAAIRSLTDAADRQILERLLGARPHLEWSGWTDMGQELSRVQVPGVLVDDIVPSACTTGRCMLRLSAPAEGAGARAESGMDIANRWLDRRTASRFRAALATPVPPSLEPIAWDDGPPWAFTVSIRRSEPDPEYVVEGWLARDDQRMALADPVLLLADGLLFTRTHAARLDHHGAFMWLAALRRAGRITMPVEARDELMDALLASPPQLAEVTDDLRVERCKGSPVRTFACGRSPRGPIDSAPIWHSNTRARSSPPNPRVPSFGNRAPRARSGGMATLSGAPSVCCANVAFARTGATTRARASSRSRRTCCRAWWGHCSTKAGAWKRLDGPTASRARRR